MNGPRPDDGVSANPSKRATVDPTVESEIARALGALIVAEFLRSDSILRLGPVPDATDEVGP